MNTYKALIEAFQIFDKYQPDETFVVSAEHDIIYTGCSPDLVSDDDKKRLAELGFHIDEHLDSFYMHT
jgi:hypothetical protein